MRSSTVSPPAGRMQSCTKIAKSPLPAGSRLVVTTGTVRMASWITSVLLGRAPSSTHPTRKKAIKKSDRGDLGDVRPCDGTRFGRPEDLLDHRRLRLDPHRRSRIEPRLDAGRFCVERLGALSGGPVLEYSRERIALGRYRGRELLAMCAPSAALFNTLSFSSQHGLARFGDGSLARGIELQGRTLSRHPRESGFVIATSLGHVDALGVACDGPKRVAEGCEERGGCERAGERTPKFREPERR